MTQIPTTNSTSATVYPVIPGYQVIDRLGAGATATVYKARQLTLDRLVAIKVLNRRAGSDLTFARKLLSEGRAAAKLNHPNAVQAFDVGQAGELLYFVMEFIEGTTVQQRLQRQGRYPQQEALQIILQVAQALQQAHRMGMIHCDIKPHNIMITPQSIAKLADLGLVRQVSGGDPRSSSSAGKPFGTPFYISPEQVRGEANVDGRSDIYSLGATLYHMITGKVPFEGDSASLIMRQHLTAKLTPPDQVCTDVTPAVAGVIEKMMAKEIDERYPTVDQLIEDLQAVLTTGTPIHAQRDFDVSALDKLDQKAPDAKEKPKAGSLEELLQNPLMWALVGSVVLNILLLLLLVLS